MAKRKFYVQLWDCPNCEEKGLNALQYKQCPTCGQVLSDDFLKDLNYREQVEIDENDLQYQQAAAGVDWLCSVCGKRNSGRYEFCQCGHARTDFKSAAGAEDKAGKTTGGIKDWTKDESQLEAKRRKTEKAKDQSDFKRKAIIIGSGLALLALILFLTLYKTELDVKVTRHLWWRSADLQNYQEVYKTDWDDRVPYEARIISRSREIFRYDKVKVGERTEWVNETREVRDGYETVIKTKNVVDHYETKTRMERRGNGVVEEVEYEDPVYAEEEYTEEVPRYRTVTERVAKVVPVYEDVPVYKYKVRYAVNEWVTVRTQEERGEDTSPRWPGGNLSENVPAPRLGDQRLANKRDEYSLVFTDREGKTYTQKYAENIWRSLEQEKEYKATKSLGGTIKVVQGGK